MAPARRALPKRSGDCSHRRLGVNNYFEPPELRSGAVLWRCALALPVRTALPVRGQCVASAWPVRPALSVRPALPVRGCRQKPAAADASPARTLGLPAVYPRCPLKERCLEGPGIGLRGPCLDDAPAKPSRRRGGGVLGHPKSWCQAVPSKKVEDTPSRPQATEITRDRRTPRGRASEEAGAAPPAGSPRGRPARDPAHR